MDILALITKFDTTHESVSKDCVVRNIYSKLLKVELWKNSYIYN